MMKECWVICINCGKRYFLERYNKNGCPVCSSKAYEPDDEIDGIDDIDFEE